MSKRNVRLEVRGGQTDTAILRKTQLRICYVTGKIQYSCEGPHESVLLRGRASAAMARIQPTEHGASFCWVYDLNHMLPYQLCVVANQTMWVTGQARALTTVLQQHVSKGTASAAHTGNRPHHRFGTSGIENLQSEPI